MTLTKDTKKLNLAAYIITGLVFISVGLMRRIKIDVGVDLSFLAGVHALINACVALVLIVALYYIKQKQIEKHERMMFIALGLSVLFLISYVAYHFTTPETSFCKEGAIRTVYYFFLITHIVLAGISLPFILFTFIRGYTRQVSKHKKMAKWVYPIWLYVAITGPVVYLMLYPCYGQ